MAELFMSAVLGYKYDNDYLALAPPQKEVVDTQILRELNGRFPRALRKSWMTRPLKSPYVSLTSVRAMAEALLEELPGEQRLSLESGLTPRCTYVLIDGAHRYYYSFLLSEGMRGDATKAELRATLGASDKPHTVAAQLELTMTWERRLPREAFKSDADFVMDQLVARIDALEKRLAGGSNGNPDFHPGMITAADSPHG